MEQESSVGIVGVRRVNSMAKYKLYRKEFNIEIESEDSYIIEQLTEILTLIADRYSKELEERKVNDK